jgi:hypothetical protein
VQDSGALVPVNSLTLFPESDEPSTGLMQAAFMQFLSPKLGVVAGKIFTLDAAAGEFACNFRTQFLNAGLAVLPMSFVLLPISAYGGGVVALPWEGPWISGDRVQLQQVLVNLIVNAFEAMDEIADGPRTVTLRTRASTRTASMWTWPTRAPASTRRRSARSSSHS